MQRHEYEEAQEAFVRAQPISPDKSTEMKLAECEKMIQQQQQQQEEGKKEGKGQIDASTPIKPQALAATDTTPNSSSAPASAPSSSKSVPKSRVSVQVAFTDSPSTSTANSPVAGGLATAVASPPSTPTLHPVLQGILGLDLNAQSPSSSSIAQKASRGDEEGGKRNESDEEGSGKQINSSSVRPLASKQRKDIDKLLQQHSSDYKSPLEAGTALFLLESKWWLAWRSYVAASNDNETTSEASDGNNTDGSKGTSSIITTVKEDVEPPPPINNWPLTTVKSENQFANYIYSKCAFELRQGLTEDRDFVALPKVMDENTQTYTNTQYALATDIYLCALALHALSHALSLFQKTHKTAQYIHEFTCNT